MSEHALVGLGVIIVNKDGRILAGKRKGFVPKFSIPGGSLEPGETFEEGAIREVKEEAGLDIRNPKVICVTNNLETFREIGKHFISIVLLVDDYSGELQVMEPDKCESWDWYDPKDLPTPHFDASRMGIDRYLEGTFYEGKERG